MASVTAERAYAIVPPAEQDFDEGVDFVPAPELERLANQLIDRWPELGWLGAYRITCLWKRKGGEKGGRGVWGKCIKPSGLTGYFSDAAWVIWLAANHVRDLGFTRPQIEALLYHELSHCDTDGEDMKPSLKPHDHEIFRMELERYGLWEEDLQQLAKSVQLALPVDLATGEIRG